MSATTNNPAPSSVPARRRPGAGQIAGELLLTVGALLLLFVFYEAFWTNLAANRLQNEAAAGLEEMWDAAPAAAQNSEPIPSAVPPLGEPFARIHMPAIGPDATYAVVEGTRNEDLRTGPVHYPETQMPGERGNAALAGHRNGSGAVFEHLDRLHSCDAVVVETETQWMTYRLLPLETGPTERLAAARECLTEEQLDRVATGDYAHIQGRHITTPDAVEVIAQLPGSPLAPGGAAEASGHRGFDDDEFAIADATADLERMLTLTTCHPLFSNAERMIVHAILVETIAKADGQLPTALEE